MEIRGYKAFNKDMTNRYGVEFKVGSVYEVEGDARFGNDGNGFHFCKRLEDTLRYFDAMNFDVSICEIVGNGKSVSFSDEYNGYYDLYCVEKMEILKLLLNKASNEALLLLSLFYEGR